MAYFAQLNESNVVTRVIAVSDRDTQDESGNEVESIGIAFCVNLLGGTWKRTSYNTYGGVHFKGKIPFRKKYAGKGYTYDETRDAFIPPKLYASWTLDESTCSWEAPVSRPDDEYEVIDGLNTIIGRYEWNESTTSWDKIEV